MKKALLAVLSVAMAFSIVACGGGKSNDKDAQKETVASEQTSSAPVSSETAPEVDTSAEISSAEVGESGSESSSEEKVESTGTVSTISPEQFEFHLYDWARVKPVMNGIRTEKIGEYSVIKADSSDCTEEALADWYYNYVSKNDFDYCLIIYTDKDKKLGCYATDILVQKDVGIECDEYGDYYLGNSDNVTTYGPSEDGKTLTVY